MKFVITSLGRSGTASIAHWLNSTTDHRVVHEIDTEIQKSADNVNRRLVNQENYGEVSSYHRFILDDIECDKKAVIIRHPYHILISAVNRNRICGVDEWIDHINDGLLKLDEYIENGVKHFCFEKLIRKESLYRHSFLEWLEVDCSAASLFPHRNATKQRKTATVQGPSVEKLFWFAEKYYGETVKDIATVEG